MKTNAVASSLNPEAGSHPIPSDPREIEAAIRAGQECLEHFPYFEARYGERGRRFASSDGAWLVTLSELVPRSGLAAHLIVLKIALYNSQERSRLADDRLLKSGNFS